MSVATARTGEVSPLANDGRSLAGAGGQLSADGQIAAGDTPDALGDDAPQTTRLERAALRAQTAIADASRHAKPASKLGETLLRFARLADELPSRVSPSTGTAVVKRLAVRLETISERLETVGGAKPRTEPLSEKRTKRLQQRLKRTRDSIKRTLKRGDTKLRKPAASPTATT